MPQHYPFTAVVGAEPDQLDDMALALVLTTISPAIGGVLVRGEKGTAKSTLVRALAAVLPPIEVVAGDRFSSDPADSALSPDGPFRPDAPVESRPVRLVELPVGATEDRVLGSLDLEQALGSGVTRYEPGLLARAHRGVLYVDEVNLLHDHLVDLLLDAAAMGRSTVERDGVSVEHAARFVLIGTMNPEEGELRPQLLDRFGLAVEVAAPREPATRAEVVRRRLAFDADPTGFAARFADAEAALTARISAAQDLVTQVPLDDATLVSIAELCSAFGVDGLRADIVTARTAAAHAAWHGRTTITRDDVRAAARLALPHRRRRNPFDETGLDESELDDLLGPDEPPAGGPDDGGSDGPDDEGPDDGGPDGGGPGGGSDTPADAPAPGEAPAPSGGDSGEGSGQAAESTVGAGQPVRARLLQVDGVGAGVSGRRSRAVTDDGRRIGARTPAGRSGSLHLVETVRAAAPHQHARGRADGGRVLLRPADLRVAVREGRESNLVLLCVDASGSMAARRRMEQVKTAVLSLLLDAYQRRDKVGLVTFRGAGATLDLPPTSSVDVAARRLEELPAGGRTPLAEGLAAAADALRLERIRDPLRRPLLVVVTDGRATSGPDALARAHRAADHLHRSGVASVVVDCETGGFRLGLASVLADRLGAQHLPLGEVSAESLTSAVRTVREVA
ncbi:VWA domain-containing protein [Aeromicrobium sp. Leaf291]|uniref:VWA domain-containing protein n=1 Tax=Aeromicrobium sp. Leaf291 TaxID=1736325 RepID=UPI0006F4ACBB|nr:VWA domain-containing protein [Aeromicrobium sp. Leaf291]KQP83450.1 magnesium chelatase [Aeromicrobium sp. Leaf291]